MKFSISNIAWDTQRMDEFLCLIAGLRCDLELSPSMIWQEPSDATESAVVAFGKKVKDYGLSISSMHSLTYSRPDLTFFNGSASRDSLVEYIVMLGRMCCLLKIPHMVFGSSRARQIGKRDRAESFVLMADTFRRMAEGLASMDVSILIEPLSRQEADSINSCSEAVELIRAVGHPNFGLHVDLKSSFAEHEDLDQAWKLFGSYIRHCHVANPGFMPPGPDCSEHMVAARVMKKYSYSGYVSIEMKRCNDPVVVERAVKFVQDVYGA